MFASKLVDEEKAPGLDGFTLARNQEGCNHFNNFIGIECLIKV